MSEGTNQGNAVSPEVAKIEQDLESAFSKLPTLGPVAWLYSRTPDRRYQFLGDLDWTVIPALTLDQCRLFMKGKMPFAFVTWATVSDSVHQRLESGVGKLAPHEWKSGNHLWIIDVVVPFGGLEEVLRDVHQLKFKEQPRLRYLWPNLATQKLEVKYFEPGSARSTIKNGDISVVPAPTQKQ